MALSLVPPSGGPPEVPPPPLAPEEPQEFVWMNAWQGGTKTTKPPLIHGKLLELRREIKSLAAKKAPGVPFPVRGAKDLAQKLADALNKLDLIAPVIDQKFTHMETTIDKVGASKNGGPAYRSMLHVVSTVRIIAPDGSFIDMVGSGHGADSDDKAGGKASTYSWKDAILKGLTIPDQDMIDTDDEAGDPPVNQARPQAKVMDQSGPWENAKEPASVEHIVDAATGLPGLNYALTQIEAASTSEDMAVIKKAIVSGSIDLSGGDKVKASLAYVTKEKLIKAKEKAAKDEKQ